MEEEIENIEGHLNAYIQRGQKTNYGKVVIKDVNKALDILADIMQNSKFDEDRINRELLFIFVCAFYSLCSQ